jgi:hypothetical protein
MRQQAMTVSHPSPTDGNLAAEAGRKIPFAAFLIPAMIERRKSGHGNARIIDRDLFIAIYIPIGG